MPVKDRVQGIHFFPERKIRNRLAIVEAMAIEMLRGGKRG
jgi:hypothetical protein